MWLKKESIYTLGMPLLQQSPLSEISLFIVWSTEIQKYYMENSRNKQVKFLVFWFFVFLNHILKYNGYLDIIIINLTKRICFCFSKKFMLVAAKCQMEKESGQA